MVLLFLFQEHLWRSWVRFSAALGFLPLLAGLQCCISQLWLAPLWVVGAAGQVGLGSLALPAVAWPLPWPAPFCFSALFRRFVLLQQQALSRTSAVVYLLPPAAPLSPRLLEVVVGQAVAVGRWQQPPLDRPELLAQCQTRSAFGSL